MAQINDDYLKLPGSYLFADIAHKVNAFKENHPEMELIRLGIGDVTRPLPPSVIKALHKAVDEQATAEGFRGYGPEQGYRFLREAIAQGDFASRGVEIDPDDIFVSDGAKCDLGNFQELFGRGNVIAVTDPVYPVYVDSNVMGGRAGTFDGNGSWSGIVYLPCSAENGFVPSLPLKRPDVIYLCLPNNPTGTALSRPELQRWVDYARSNQCLILFDAAYEAYIREDGIPHSIYELEGAKEVAVEFRSFSKPAGFTGLRCGYVVIPETVKARAARWSDAAPQAAVEPPPDDQVQRLPLHRSARRRSRLFTRRAAGCTRQCGLLHGKRLDHPWRAASGGTGRLRGGERSVHLAEDAGRHGFVALFRSALEPFRHSGDSRRGVRPER